MRPLRSLLLVVFMLLLPAARAVADDSVRPEVLTLMAAVRDGDLRAAEAALAVVGSPNVRSAAMTPLWYAAGRGDAPMCELLLAHGADPNFMAADGTTPFATAVGAGRLNTMRILLDAGADADQGVVAATAAAMMKGELVGRLKYMADAGGERSGIPPSSFNANRRDVLYLLDDGLSINLVTRAARLADTTRLGFVLDSLARAQRAATGLLGPARFVSSMLLRTRRLAVDSYTPAVVRMLLERARPMVHEEDGHDLARHAFARRDFAVFEALVVGGLDTRDDWLVDSLLLAPSADSAFRCRAFGALLEHGLDSRSLCRVVRRGASDLVRVIVARKLPLPECWAGSLLALAGTERPMRGSTPTLAVLLEALPAERRAPAATEALQAWVQSGNVEGVRLLLAAGARLDAASASLVDAVQSGLPTMVAFVRDAGADSVSERTRTAALAMLENNAREGKGSEIYHALEQPFIRRWVQGEAGVALLDTVSSLRPGGFAHDSDYDLAVSGLLKAGVPVNRPAATPYSPALISAAALGWNSSVRSLLAHGASVNGADPDGRTPLKACVWSGLDLSTLRTLLDAGADPNWDGKGKFPRNDAWWPAPLISAVQSAVLMMDSSPSYNADMIKTLLEAGADVHAKNARGRSVMQIAEDAHHTALVQLLRTTRAVRR